MFFLTLPFVLHPQPSPPDKALQAAGHQSYTAPRNTELQLLKQFNQFGLNAILGVESPPTH
jgi:hypothetical protein